MTKNKARFELSANNRRLLILFAIIFVSSLVTYFFSDKLRTLKPDASTPDPVVTRDYRRSPFNMSDAYEHCVKEAGDQLGSDLQRYTMDDLSTKYNTKTNIYFVVLKVDVGSIREFREASVYCNVDPTLHQVTYYKEVYPGEDRSILSRTIEFFSKD